MYLQVKIHNLKTSSVLVKGPVKLMKLNLQGEKHAGNPKANHDEIDRCPDAL